VCATMLRAAAIALLLVALTGCGGSDGDGEFSANANRICREAEAQLAEVVEQAQGDPAVVLQRGLEAYAPYMDRLRALDVPDDLRADWTAFLDGVQEAFDLFPRLATATRTADAQDLSELADRFEAIARDTRPFAEQHGLDDCLPDGSRS
jgi:hypothetical protein